MRFFLFKEVGGPVDQRLLSFSFCRPVPIDLCRFGLCRWFFAICLLCFPFSFLPFFLLLLQAPTSSSLSKRKRQMIRKEEEEEREPLFLKTTDLSGFRYTGTYLRMKQTKNSTHHFCTAKDRSSLHARRIHKHIKKYKGV